MIDLATYGWANIDPDAVYKFHNCRVLRESKLVENDSIWVRNGVILDAFDLFQNEKKSFDVEIDLGGCILSPGFIDIQINGGFGIDFTSTLVDNPSSLKKVASLLPQHGVTAFCPTIVTSPRENYQKILQNLTIFKGGADGATCLGAHLEGPFISEAQKGAHDLQSIRDYPEGMNSVLSMYGPRNMSKIAIVTLAPEKPRSSEVIEGLTNMGITVSLGHSAAMYEEAMQGVQHGAKLITHLFNSMTQFHHRNPGIIGLLGRQTRPAHFGLVADGHHTHATALRLAYEAQPTGIALVTDATSAMGLEDGRYILGTKAIVVDGSRAVIEGTNILSGSATPMIKCIKYFKEATNCSFAGALSAATLRPAEVLNIEDRKGCLKPGADADLTVLDDNLSVLSTWVAGRLVYIRQQNG